MTGRLVSALSACLLLAACGGGEQAAAPLEPPAIADPATLAGEYRVAGINGSEIDLPHAITASIDGERIHLTSDCVNFAWSYRFEGEALVTEQVPVESCARGFDATEQELLAAFDVADAVH
ncbi:MAG TPA: hypothetical protein VI168_15170, partial [Croceibacterium sp.]